jgi:hypothetical protein
MVLVPGVIRLREPGPNKPRFREVESAFAHCSIQTVAFDLPSQLEVIESSCFAHAHIQSLRLPDHLAALGSGSFRTSSIDNVELAGQLKVIGSFCFTGSSSSSVIVPPSVECICESCFADARIRAVEFGEDSKLAELAGCCFAGCALGSFGQQYSAPFARNKVRRMGLARMQKRRSRTAKMDPASRILYSGTCERKGIPTQLGRIDGTGRTGQINSNRLIETR